MPFRVPIGSSASNLFTKNLSAVIAADFLYVICIMYIPLCTPLPCVNRSVCSKFTMI